jgi:hypothetical protein
VPGRHFAARHRTPKSLKRSLGRLANDVAGRVPSATVLGTAALLGAAGVVVGVGVVTSGASADKRTPSHNVVESLTARASAEPDAEPRVSRSSARPSLVQQRAVKQAGTPLNAHQVSGGELVTVKAADPRDIARSMLGAYGWSSDQFSCLDSLYVSESNWNPSAENPYSGAYGIPQSLPADKMASAGPDWRTNPATQIEWGLEYIRDSYGSPCSAWSFKQSNNWY